ncbi:N-terminal EF-hand calcium-binding protein 1-like isoform X2 [Stigmatopora argus]
MLSCTEMITACLQSAKRKHVWSQQKQQQQLQQQQLSNGRGLSILHDIFRRADKNDDGQLSFKEFNAYFADGVLTTAQLRELFYSIDGRQNDNLDTDKLSDYFSQHLGDFVNVLSAVEKLNVVLLKTMYKTKEEYGDSGLVGQFVTRFLLRETSAQLLSLLSSVQSAVEALDQQSTPVLAQLESGDPNFGPPAPKNHPNAVTRRSQIKGEEEKCKSQIARLQQLLDKLERQSPKLEPLKKDGTTATANILLVQRKMTVNDSELDQFQKVLQSYAAAASLHSDNLRVCVQKGTQKSSFVIYEFWRDRLSWISYQQSNGSKDFQRWIIDMLVEPGTLSTMALPETTLCGQDSNNDCKVCPLHGVVVNSPDYCVGRWGSNPGGC